MNTQPTIFITGAASGIGRAVAQYFVGKGWRAGLYDLNEEALAVLHQQLGETTCYRHIDVTDVASVQEALHHFSTFTRGRLDVLFNCAGVLAVGPFEQIDLEAHQKIVAVNLAGIINCTHLAFPLLQASAPARVINMASASALYGTPDMASYSATKFAVRGLTEALNIEWQRHHICVSDILPPFVKTPMLQQAPETKSMRTLGVRLTAVMVARTVWRAAHGKRVHYPMTWSFKMLWVLAKLLPGRLNRLTMKLISGY